MLITVDKRGSINLPASLRRQLGLVAGACLELNRDRNLIISSRLTSDAKFKEWPPSFSA